MSGGFRVVRLGVIDSTSLHARREVETGRGPGAPTVFVAEEQTGGVGRFGRRWFSPRGGLWCTFVWPRGADTVAGGLGLRVGLAVLGAVDDALAGAVGPERVRLKWPNDVLIDGKKVAGVLCEVVRGPGAGRGRGAVLVGVGINADCDEGQLPEGLSRPPVTLRGVLGRGVLGRGVDLQALLEGLAGRVGAALAAAESGPLDAATVREAVSRLYGMGERAAVTLPDGSRREGVIEGLDADGRLMLRAASGLEALPSGSDVSESPGRGGDAPLRLGGNGSTGTPRSRPGL